MKIPEDQNQPPVTTEEPVEVPKGRAALLALYKNKNPEATEDPDDDTLSDFGVSGHTERDEMAGKYEKLNGSNGTLAAAIGQYPVFAHWIAKIGQGENPWFALGKALGPLADKLDDESLEQMRKGQEERAAQSQQVNQNFSNYEANLKAYVEKNGLSEEQAVAINNLILDLAEAFIERDIPEEVIDLVYKSLDYDDEKTAQADALKLATKNEMIDEFKKTQGSESAIPDLAGANSGKRAAKPSVQNTEAAYKPLSETMEVLPKKR